MRLSSNTSHTDIAVLLILSAQQLHSSCTDAVTLLLFFCGGFHSVLCVLTFELCSQGQSQTVHQHTDQSQSSSRCEAPPLHVFPVNLSVYVFQTFGECEPSRSYFIKSSLCVFVLTFLLHEDRAFTHHSGDTSTNWGPSHAVRFTSEVLFESS